jgi:hypothetical protein
MKKNETRLALKVFKHLSENSDLDGNLEIQRKIGECYLKLGEHQNALSTYEAGEMKFSKLQWLPSHQRVSL